MGDDPRYGYDSDNECETLLDAISVEEGCDDDKDIPDSMVGGCREGNEITFEAGNLVLLRDI